MATCPNCGASVDRDEITPSVSPDYAMGDYENVPITCPSCDVILGIGVSRALTSD